MTSKKIENNIDTGLWSYYSDDHVAVASHQQPDIDQDGVFVISYHHGEMPAFNSEQFATLDELEAKMRELQPDLRKWHTTFG